MSTDPAPAAAPAPATITLLNRAHAVLLPSFADREDLYWAYTRAVRRRDLAPLRAGAALLGMCTRIGRAAGVELAGCDHNVLEYGGRIYSWLREQGCSAKDIADAVKVVYPLLSKSLMPREAEITAEAGNSDGRAHG